MRQINGTNAFRPIRVVFAMIPRMVFALILRMVFALILRVAIHIKRRNASKQAKCVRSFDYYYTA